MPSFLACVCSLSLGPNIFLAVARCLSVFLVSAKYVIMKVLMKTRHWVVRVNKEGTSRSSRSRYPSQTGQDGGLRVARDIRARQATLVAVYSSPKMLDFFTIGAKVMWGVELHEATAWMLNNPAQAPKSKYQMSSFLAKCGTLIGIHKGLCTLNVHWPFCVISSVH